MCIKNQSVTPGLYNLGPDYSTCTGSSMATPHVAGMVALLRVLQKATYQPFIRINQGNLDQ